MSTGKSAAGSRAPAFARRMAATKPSAIREILKVTEAPDVISFAGGLPASELFPIEAIARAAAEVLAQDGPAALQYGVTEGHAPLRAWVAEHLKATVGLHASPDGVLITHGSQQALDLLAKVLLDPGDTVLVEEPAYLGALQAFRAYEANPLGVASDEAGLSPAALEAALQARGRPPKFLYLIPNFQNPTGRSLSAWRRSELAAIAARYDLLVVEDDPYGQLRYSGDALPAVATELSDDRWVYLGTASKILTPGLRVAWLATGNAALHERLVTAKQSTDLHTTTFGQRVVHAALQQPDFLRTHLASLCTAYGARRDAMLSALATHLGGKAEWTQPEGGLFLWLTLRDSGQDALRLLEEAMKHRVAFVPGAPFWVHTPRQNTLRLNFSHAGEARIEEGIRRLATALKALTSAN